MVDVQEGSLGTFEQHLFPGLEPVPQEKRGVGDVGPEPVGVAGVLVDYLVSLHREHVVDARENLVLLFESGLDLLPENLGVEEVLHPDAESGVLVGIGGADSLLGGADLVLAQIALDRGVELSVIRHDHVGIGGQAHPRRVELFGGGHLHLVDENLGVDDGPRRDHRSAVGVEDA